MAIPSRQIGWSTQANLLWQISKQLERLTCVTACGCGTTTTTTTIPPTTTTTTTTICNCREIIEALSFGFNFYTCLGEYVECLIGEACRSPVGKCIDISQPYTGIGTSETITLTCNCNPLINATSTFVQCGVVDNCIGDCAGEFSYYDVWMTQECIDSWPSIGCAVWLDQNATIPFPDGSYNNGFSACIQLTNGVVVAIP